MIDWAYLAHNIFIRHPVTSCTLHLPGQQDEQENGQTGDDGQEDGDEDGQEHGKRMDKNIKRRW